MYFKITSYILYIYYIIPYMYFKNILNYHIYSPTSNPICILGEVCSNGLCNNVPISIRNPFNRIEIPTLEIISTILLLLLGCIVVVGGGVGGFLHIMVSRNTPTCVLYILSHSTYKTTIYTQLYILPMIPAGNSPST